MKVGILTYFGAHNYGAFLQAYALREIVNNIIGGNVELINYRSMKEVKAYSVKRLPLFGPKNYALKLKLFSYNKLQFDTFEKSILKYQTVSKELLYSDSIEEFADFVKNRYDLIIAGSDEIWKTDGFRSFPNAYWLPDITCNKMAYAVSSRNVVSSLSDDRITLIREYIKSFNYIGTRDQATLKLVTELSGDPEKCYLNCDPTFLYDFLINKENGEKILQKKFHVEPSKKVIGLMLSDVQYGRKLSEFLNQEFEVVSLCSYIDGAKNYAGLSPFDWIDVIAACDMIISSRFHGVVFSIKSSKPFLAIELDGYNKETSKLFDLLNRNNLLGSYVEADEGITEVLLQRIPNFLKSSRLKNYDVDYSKVIESERKLAESFVSRLRWLTV